MNHPARVCRRLRGALSVFANGPGHDTHPAPAGGGSFPREGPGLWSCLGQDMELATHGRPGGAASLMEALRSTGGQAGSVWACLGSSPTRGRETGAVGEEVGQEAYLACHGPSLALLWHVKHTREPCLSASGSGVGGDRRGCGKVQGSLASCQVESTADTGQVIRREGPPRARAVLRLDPPLTSLHTDPCSLYHPFPQHLSVHPQMEGEMVTMQEGVVLLPHGFRTHQSWWCAGAGVGGVVGGGPRLQLPPDPWDPCFCAGTSSWVRIHLQCWDH